MVIKISQKTLMKTLEGKGDRIVLGRIDPSVARWYLIMGSALLFGVIGVFTMGGKPLSAVAPMLAIPSALCYLVGACRSRLTLDLLSCTYLHEYGFYPFIARRQGSLAEFDHLIVSAHHGFTGNTLNDFLLQLVPKDGAPTPRPGRKPVSTGKPLTLCIDADIPKCPKPNVMQEVALMLAQTVGLPFEDDPPASISPPTQAKP